VWENSQAQRIEFFGKRWYGETAEANDVYGGLDAARAGLRNWNATVDTQRTYLLKTYEPADTQPFE